MDTDTLLNLGLVMVFVLVGGVFAATELALVSLRESQLNQLEKTGSRGTKVATLARDPNTFLAAVQIGVTVAGFLSAAYGASTLAPDVAPTFEALGLSESAASSVALVAMTLLIAYLSLVFGELVPKRFALQKSAPIALAVAPPLARFATLMRPVIWLLSKSTKMPRSRRFSKNMMRSNWRFRHWANPTAVSRTAIMGAGVIFPPPENYVRRRPNVRR